MRKYLALIGVLSGLEIALVLYLSFWREAFWSDVTVKNLHGFTNQLLIFTVVALILCLITGCSGYVASLTAIEWRKKLNSRATLIGSDNKIENVNQRIQEDCRDYPTLVINIGVGTVKAITYVIVFAISLIYNFSVIYLIIISVYTLLSTLLAKKIADPLISLNYRTQQAEATYRNNLQGSNKKLIALSFTNCISIMLQLAKKTKHLQYFQSLYGQVGVIIPIIIVAPAYFIGSMTFGLLMQATNTMSIITDNLSFGITSFNDINRLLSCRKRLKEINLL